MSQRAFVAAQPVRAAPKATRAARCAVVLRASAEESRRAVLGGLLAGAVALTAGAANAANDIIDDRKAIEKGFNWTYEARDTDLPQNVRDGLTQARADLEGLKKRIAVSEKKIDTELESYIKKNYWTEGREQLRLQAGTLRFDINSVADTLPKAAKKEVLAAKSEFFAVVDDLDFAMRKKNEAKALKALEKAKAKLDATLAKLS
ncbi:hypothetical protein N2152v2_010712 [Parachlorella kessleri]